MISVCFYHSDILSDMKIYIRTDGMSPKVIDISVIIHSLYEISCT